MNSDFCCSPLQWGWPLFGGHGGGPRGVPLNPIHNNNNSAFGQQSPQPPIISSFGRWCNDLHYFPMESGSIPTDFLPSAPGNEEEVKVFLLASPLSAFAAMDTKGPFFANCLCHCKWLVLHWPQCMLGLWPRWTHLVKVGNGWPAVTVLHHWLQELESQWEQHQGPHLWDLPIVTNQSFWIIFNYPLMI